MKKRLEDVPLTTNVDEERSAKNPPVLNFPAKASISALAVGALAWLICASALPKSAEKILKGSSSPVMILLAPPVSRKGSSALAVSPPSSLAIGMKTVVTVQVPNSSLPPSSHQLGL